MGFFKKFKKRLSRIVKRPDKEFRGLVWKAPKKSIELGGDSVKWARSAWKGAKTLFDKPEVPDPSTPPVLSQVSDEERQRLLGEQQALERRKRGRGSTLVTGGGGLKARANTKRKTLLGQ